MARPGEHEQSVDFVKASLTYLVDTGEKPVSYSVGPDSTPVQHKGRYEEHTVTIHNGRLIRDRLSLDREGFVFITHETKVSDFYDEDQVRSVYYPEVERLVKGLTGASKVLIFDHTLRAEDDATREEKKVREPVRRVHNDYTEWSGPQRVRDLFPADEAEALLQHRFAVIQVWQPIRKPVQTVPLAIADARSLARDNLIATERRYPDRVGEVYHITFHPDHRWVYFPKMQKKTRRWYLKPTIPKKTAGHDGLRTRLSMTRRACRMRRPARASKCARSPSFHPGRQRLRRSNRPD